MAAALPQPALPGGSVPQAAPLTNFRQRYLDQSYDSNSGNIANLMAFFDPEAEPARDPMTLRNAVVNESDRTSHAYLILQQDPATPDDPGQITVLHGVKMYPTQVGAGAGQWQGQLFAFVHDVLDHKVTRRPSNFRWTPSKMPREQEPCSAWYRRRSSLP
jgi:hypothetical protein